MWINLCIGFLVAAAAAAGLAFGVPGPHSPAAAVAFLAMLAASSVSLVAFLVAAPATGFCEGCRMWVCARKCPRCGSKVDAWRAGR